MELRGLGPIKVNGCLELEYAAPKIDIPHTPLELGNSSPLHEGFGTQSLESRMRRNPHVQAREKIAVSLTFLNLALPTGCERRGPPPRTSLCLPLQQGTTHPDYVQQPVGGPPL